MASNACSSWWHGDCEGTPACPPRCPRFVDRDGRAYLVEPATSDGIDDIVDMYRDYPIEHRSMGLPPRSEPRIREWLERLDDRGRNFAATHDGHVVGHAAYAPLDADVPELIVYVDPDYHGRGLGTELVTHVLADASANDCSGVALDVDRGNLAAIHVYRDLGFETVDETPTDYEMHVATDDPIVLHLRKPPAERDLDRPTRD
jgi:RimJ/RimL family protein N-acetyltransferase